MFSFENASIPVNLEEILSKVSDYQIFKYYCENFEEIDKSFKSSLYSDRNPGCRIYVNGSGQLMYKDFGNGDHFSPINYVMAKYRCNFQEALNIIANDFNIKKIDPKIPVEIILANDLGHARPMTKVKTGITIQPQPFNSTDAEYWEQFGIQLTTLLKYNVFSCKTVYVYKGDSSFSLEYSKNNPIYAYRFNSGNEYHYKIYRPYAEKKKKWLFNGGSDNIEGYDQLPSKGKILIITKSLKDCICYNELGYAAISLQGEHNQLKNSLLDKLYKRFDYIILNYDNDEDGKKATEKIASIHNIPYFYIHGAKDLSDLIKNSGINQAKIQINDKIESIL